EAKHSARACTLWNRELHPAGYGRHLDLGAEHGLVDGDRQIELDIIAHPLEVGMRLHLDLDQRIAGLAAAHTGRALTFEPPDLAGGASLRHGEMEHAAGGHGQPFLYAGRCLEKVDFQGVAHIAAGRAKGTSGASARAPAPGTEQIGKDVAKSEIVTRAPP